MAGSFAAEVRCIPQAAGQRVPDPDDELDMRSLLRHLNRSGFIRGTTPPSSPVDSLVLPRHLPHHPRSPPLPPLFPLLSRRHAVLLLPRYPLHQSCHQECLQRCHQGHFVGFLLGVCGIVTPAILRGRLRGPAAGGGLGPPAAAARAVRVLQHGCAEHGRSRWVE